MRAPTGPRELSALPAPPAAAAARAPELVAALVTVVIAAAGYLWLAREAIPHPAGVLGHSLGILGLLLMVFAEVGYSWRKRTSRSGPGPVRAWLQLHVYAGIVGPFLVLLHTSFRFRGLAGVLTLIMLVVVGSGVVGRFVYGGMPRGEARRNLVRRGASVWYLLHVPLALAMFALAAVHLVAALYFATFLRR